MALGAAVLMKLGSPYPIRAGAGLAAWASLVTAVRCLVYLVLGVRSFPAAPPEWLDEAASCKVARNAGPALTVREGPFRPLANGASACVGQVALRSPTSRSPIAATTDSGTPRSQD